MNASNAKVPAWFWILTVIFLLWNTVGLSSFMSHTFMAEKMMESMTPEQIALMDEYPLWSKIVFAVATIAGFLGALGMVLRKKWARMLLMISLVAVLIQMGHNLFMTSAIEVYGTTQAVMMPVLVIILAFIQVWFAGFSQKKGWIPG